jgi:2'-5' RNA ligase
MRLFVGLWPSHEAIAQLGAAVEEIRSGPAASGSDRVRWTAPTQWHLTLAFLGEVSDDHLPQLRRRLARTAARRHAPTLEFSGAGRFGDRVLFARVGGDTHALRLLAGSVTAAVRRSGLPVDERPYRAHLTLARGLPGSDLRPLVAALAGFRGRPWVAQDLALVHSRLAAGPGGRAVYEIIGRWPLAADTADGGPPHRPPDRRID